MLPLEVVVALRLLLLLLLLTLLLLDEALHGLHLHHLLGELDELALLNALLLEQGAEVAVVGLDAADDRLELLDLGAEFADLCGVARRARRIELARGWRFKCECARCLAEALAELAAEDAAAAKGAGGEQEEEVLGVRGDESVTENVVRHEGNTAGEPAGLSMMGAPEMGPD